MGVSIKGRADFSSAEFTPVTGFLSYREFSVVLLFGVFSTLVVCVDTWFMIYLL